MDTIRFALYGVSFMAPDQIRKGCHIETWVIMSGMSIGRTTVNFGSHCLSDDLRLVTGLCRSFQERGESAEIRTFWAEDVS